MTATKRFLRVVLPFEQTASGKLIGGVMIQTPAPFKATDFYYVTVDGHEAIFVKEDSQHTTHICDTDMRSCDCPGFRYRAKCRHLECLESLKRHGKI